MQLLSAYPDFVPNQVLTDAQLNQLRDYLDGQTRLGRLRTVGQGIACGLAVDISTEPPAVRVGGGYGVTSDGHLVEHGADVQPSGDVVFEALAYTRVVAYTDPGAPTYEPWQNGSSQIGLLRLLQADEAAEGARDLDADDLDGAAVVLYLERAEQELDGCFVTSCDDRGRRVQYAVRVLLVNVFDLAPPPHPGLADGPVARPRVPRLQAVLADRERTLSGLRSRDELVEAVQDAARQGAEATVRALERIAERYGSVAGGLQDLPDAVGDALATAVDEGADRAPLVVLEHVGTVAEAVGLLARAACATGIGCGAPGGYARHLALSGEDVELGAPRRHHWLPAPVVTRDARADVDRAIARVLALAEAFDLDRALEAEEPRATASQTLRHPLPGRALPAYYDSRTLAPTWPDRCDGGPLFQFGQTLDLEGDTTDDERDGGLDAVYAGVSLVRLEGLLGRDARRAAEEVDGLRARLGLEFSLVLAGLDVDPEEVPDPSPDDPFAVVSFPAWAADKPGLEPLAGVEPGGTFVLLAEEGRVVGDLALRCCAGRPAAPEPDPEPTVGTLEVTVRDADGPLVGALVNVIRLVSGTPTTVRTGLTDADGRIAFNDLPPGTVTVQASASGYQQATATGVEVVAGDTAVADLVLARAIGQGVAQIIVCPGRVPEGRLSIDGDSIVVAEGGSIALALDEGEHELALPDALTVDAKRRFFEKARLRPPVRFTVEAGRRTTLFVTEDAEGATTVLGTIEDIPRDIPRGAVRVRVFNDAGLTGRITAVLDTSEETLAEGLVPGAIADPIDVPALDDRLWIYSARDQELFDFPASGLGGTELRVLVCGDGVYFVAAGKDRVQATRIKGVTRTDDEADVRAELPSDLQEVIATRERERSREAEEAARRTSIDTTKTYQDATDFIEKTAVRADVRAEDLTEAYRELVETLEIRIRDGSETTAEGYRALLESATLAYLDRTARYPDGGGAAVEVEVGRIQETLVVNGLNATAVLDKWNPAELEVALETTSGTVRRF